MDVLDAAALTCVGVTTNKAVKVANPRPAQLVAVLGIGGPGHLALQYAKIFGAVAAVDEKLELARELGADHTVNTLAQDRWRRSRRSTARSGQSPCRTWPMCSSSTRRARPGSSARPGARAG